MNARLCRWRRFSPAFLKYGIAHLTLYGVLWPVAFGIFAGLFFYFPESLVWFLEHVVQPVTNYILKLFLKLAWSVVPEEVHHHIQAGKNAIQAGKEVAQGALREGKSLARDILGSWYSHVAGAAKEVGAIAKEVGVVTKDGVKAAVQAAKESMSAQFKIVIHVVFNGFIVVSVLAALLRIPAAMFLLRDRFIDDLLGRATDEDIARARAKKRR